MSPARTLSGLVLPKGDAKRRTLPDVAAKNPELVARVAEIMRTAHVDNEYWKIPAK